MWGIFRPQIEIKVAVILDIVHLILKSGDDFDILLHIEQTGGYSSHPRGIDDHFGLNRKGLAFPLNHPIGENTFLIENSSHFRDLMSEV